jgi:transposase
MGMKYSQGEKKMPQLLLPIIPNGATNIGSGVSVYKDDNAWTYFVGLLPVYRHRPEDKRMFGLVTASLVEAGACKHSDIIKSFGVSKSSVNRSVKRLRNGGAEAFFSKRKSRKGGTKLTPDKLEEAQPLLDKGVSRNEVADQIDVKSDTLRKAIEDGRLREINRSGGDIEVTDKSMRSLVDAAAGEGMGTACTRVMDRVLSSLGKCNDGAMVQFEASHDVSYGGVLCALPALIANGLLEGVETILGGISGYYTMYHVLLLLAFMVLIRVKTLEQLRGKVPGELGKLLGLDRIPEVRCLREKMDAMSASDAGEKWAAHLSRHWMEKEPESVGSLYVDGHVRVYNGQLTNLPRKHVARQRLCLRGTSDYWVNDAIGRPFFKVEKAIDPGLIKVRTLDSKETQSDTYRIIRA